MSSIQLIERPGTTSPRVRIAPTMTMTWRELCVADAKRAVVALKLAGFAGFAGGTDADHAYSTRTGPSSCSPPV